MTLSDIFGDGTTETEEVIIIPRENLAVTGLSTVHPNSIIAALFFKISCYFESEISDLRGDILADTNGNTVIYARTNDHFEYRSAGKSFGEGMLIYSYLFTQYREIV